MGLLGPVGVHIELVRVCRKQVGGSQGLGRGAGGEAADGHGALPGSDENGWN